MCKKKEKEKQYIFFLSWIIFRALPLEKSKLKPKSLKKNRRFLKI